MIGTIYGRIIVLFACLGIFYSFYGFFMSVYLIYLHLCNNIIKRNMEESL